ncbi:UDP-N-acetyl-D-mannosamine dehydrogenase [Orrella sp. 11846]|uniref:UDP-N-acetyl-D-mannosamine dehydrogenase n=1 Tax=Orrella sp. 11846 TaxID=3409913 RepID=UPI003B5C1928
MSFKKVSVIGLGYIGLPTAAVLASKGTQVVGVDRNPEVVSCINQGQAHIFEPDLDVLVRNVVANGRLSATTTPQAADAFLITVPTPLDHETKQADLSFVNAAALSIAPVLEKGNLVILESTSPVGTTEQLVSQLSEARPDLTFPNTHGEQSDIRVAYCPERVLPGRILDELVNNDRVIGGMTPRCAQAGADLYKIFLQAECLLTDVRTAEMVKLTENSFRDVNIAFANELSIICEELGINVWELIALANRHPRVNILKPGPGVGGHCVAVDPWFIVSKTPELARLIRTAREVNDAKPAWVVERVWKAVGDYLLANPNKTAKDVTIVCYGLTFKPNIDDLRESPALQIAQTINDMHPGRTLVVEPNIRAVPIINEKPLTLVSMDEASMLSDVVVFLVDHEVFESKGFDAGFVVDTRRGTFVEY